jgi:hypothetical protein
VSKGPVNRSPTFFDIQYDARKGHSLQPMEKAGMSLVMPFGIA